MATSKLDQVLAAAREAGCKLKRTRKGHIKIYLPGGGMLVCAGSTSDHRSWKNLRADLRRNGVAV